MSLPQVEVTTAAALDGWTITASLGVVVEHAVTPPYKAEEVSGESALARNERYASQFASLQEIERDVVEALKTRAAMRGANLIVGLQMSERTEPVGASLRVVIVTAMGTAAVGDRTAPMTRRDQPERNVLSATDLTIRLKKREMMAKARTIPVALTADEWQFVLRNQMHEILVPMIRTMQHTARINNGLLEQGRIDRWRQYFYCLPADKSIPALYNALIHNDMLGKFLIDTIIEGQLFDFEQIRMLLNHEDLKVRLHALSLIHADKSFYTADDLPAFTKLMQDLKTAFPVRVQFVEETVLLTQTPRVRWVCSCGTKNEKDQQRCVQCGIDQYGIPQQQPSLAKAVAVLALRIDALKEAFPRAAS